MPFGFTEKWHNLMELNAQLTARLSGEFVCSDSLDVSRTSLNPPGTW